MMLTQFSLSSLRDDVTTVVQLINYTDANELNWTVLIWRTTAQVS